MTGAADAFRVLDRLNRARPDVVRLARVACLAAQVEGALLRRLRLQLLPEVDVGAEADLWFGPLVESAGVAAFALDADVADLLRQSLTPHPGLPASDRRERLGLIAGIERVLADVHAEAPPLVRLEERATLLAVRGESDEAIEAALRPAVQALMSEARGLDVARWAMRAVPRLPAQARATEAALMLALGASARLGDRPVLPPGDIDRPLSSRLAWVLPPQRLADRVRVAVRSYRGALSFHAPPTGPARGVLELPRTRPLLAELTWFAGGRMMRRTVFTEPGQVIRLPEDASALTIRTLDGSEYVLAPARRGGETARADYEFDLFISYARVDDQPPEGVREGWVSTLIRHLTRRLSQRLGREAKVWMDHSMLKNQPFDEQIEKALRGSALLMVILSPALLESRWVERELPVIREQAVERAGRIFVVEQSRVERPPWLQDYVGYRLWFYHQAEGRSIERTMGDPAPDPTRDIEYYRVVDAIALDMAKELERLSGRFEAPTPPPLDDRPAIFLAEVSDDLMKLRGAVRAYLQQMGLRVLPEQQLPLDPSLFVGEMRSGLLQSVLFVQLLGRDSNRQVTGLPEGLASLQYRLAVESGRPILRWRSPELDPDSFQDPQDRDLLDDPTVMVSGIEEFKAYIVKRVAEINRSRPSPPEPDGNGLVFIIADAVDRALAEHVGRWLNERGVASLFLRYEVGPSEMRQDMEQSLLMCDAVLVIYGQAPLSWVESMLLQIRKLQYRRERPPGLTGLYYGPPPDKTPPGLSLSNLRVIDSRTGPDDKELDRFLDEVRSRKAPPGGAAGAMA